MFTEQDFRECRLKELESKVRTITCLETKIEFCTLLEELRFLSKSEAYDYLQEVIYKNNLKYRNKKT